MVALYAFCLQYPVSIVMRNEGKKLLPQQVEPLFDSSKSFWSSHDADLISPENVQGLTIVIDHGINKAMKEVAICEFKAKCLGMLEQVRKTRKPIRITRFGEPVAEIVPPTPKK